MEFVEPTLNYLFQPITINGLKIKNRIVMPAIGTRFANENGAVTRRLIDFHTERTDGGVGLQIVEQSLVNKERPACMLSVADDRMIPGLNDLVEAIHERDGKVAIQIGNLGFAHGFNYSGSEKIGELSVSEIGGLIKEFVLAARRCQDAGFDAVEIHGAHRYLINQFLSPQTNRRSDQYGGTLGRRMNFLLEILEKIRGKVGRDFPLFVRINGDGFDPEGLGLEEAKEIARRLEAAGADAIDVSAGTWKSPERTVPPMRFPRGCHVYLAAAIKKEVNLPVMTAGRINDPLLADEIIKDNKADLVAMGRALLADPFLPQKAQGGKFQDIRYCIACNYCHGERLYKNKRIKCAVNAAVGGERDYRWKRAEKGKKVFVIGGGPAGLEAAWTLKMRGHEVVLWEKEKELGGQLRYAVIPPQKEEIKNILQFLSHQLESKGVEVHLGREIIARDLGQAPVDAIVWATGSSPWIPHWPGMDRWKIFSAREALIADPHGLGTDVMIVGGGRVGCETAEYFAEKGKRVTIIEKLDKLASEVEAQNRKLLLRRLKDLEVSIHCQSQVTGMQPGVITFLDETGQEKKLKVDSVIVAVGSKPPSDVQQEIKDRKKVIYRIGDCQKPGDIAAAIHAGAFIGRMIH